MKTTFGPVLRFLSMILLLSACAEGAPAEPETIIEPPTAPMEAPCGNGRPDPGEMCECPKSATATCLLQGMTCDRVMPGATGMLACDSRTCLLSLELCKNAMGQPLGGNGAVRPPMGTGGTGRP
jgi:hypothetical protein